MSMIFCFLQPLVSILSLIYLQNSYDLLLEVLLGGGEIQCLVQTVPCECCIPTVICHLEKMQLNNLFLAQLLTVVIKYIFKNHSI